MRRLLAFIVLLGLVAVALYYWKDRSSSLSAPRQALDSVGDKLRSTTITGSVKAAFELNRDLENQPIDVDSGEDGSITLKGEVPSEELKAAAGKVAAAVPGVRQVVNELRVNPALATAADSGRTLGESFDDRALEAKVNLAFSLNRELKGTNIKVHAYRRRVTLRGEVDGPAQRQLAVEIAGRTPDVTQVADEIVVRGQPAAPAGPPGSPLPSPAAGASVPSRAPGASPAPAPTSGQGSAAPAPGGGKNTWRTA